MGELSKRASSSAGIGEHVYSARALFLDTGSSDTLDGRANQLKCDTAPWFILCERRDELQMHLKEKGVGTRVMYPPINRQNAYHLPESYPDSERVGENGLWLRSASQLSDDQIDTVCNAIRLFYN
jgi:dTDP-4-amino-4,6-dideoxygalactose transaminase